MHLSVEVDKGILNDDVDGQRDVLYGAHCLYVREAMRRNWKPFVCVKPRTIALPKYGYIGIMHQDIIFERRISVGLQ